MRHHLYTEITRWIEEQQLPDRVIQIRFQIVTNEVDPVMLPNLYPDRVVRVCSPDAQLVPSPAFMSVLLRQALAGRGAAVFMDSHVSGQVARGELVPFLDDIAALYLQFLWHRSLDPVLADELCSAVTELRSAPAQNHRL